MDQAAFDKTVSALQENNFEVIIAETKEAVKDIVAGLLEKDSEVMQMSSVTLEETGVAELINNSGAYKSVKNMLRGAEPNDLTAKEKARLASVPDFAVGSAQAVTEAGQIVVASKSGSQIPPYAYGPGRVIFVIGQQKIVKDLDSAMKRIYEYVLPLESVRVQKAYNLPSSNVNRLLIMNRDDRPGRITVVLVKEDLGY